jgi:hypothetical protein
LIEPGDTLVRPLRSLATVRERCANILQAASDGRSVHFTVDRAQLPAVATRIARLTRERFPDLRIPYHSRWRHFEAGGVDRKGEFDARLAGRSREQIARARIDLTLVSVLLDAGAGPNWQYVESSGKAYSRSEGLGVATFRAFMAGCFSSDADDPYRVDANALLKLRASDLAEIFQMSERNPLVGLDGRTALLHRLGEALRAQPQTFTDDGRPGFLFDRLVEAAAGQPVRAAQILGALLEAFSGIWPSGQDFHGVPVGDVWPHPQAGGSGPSAGRVPFHKLSQWLTYSLLEPFEWARVVVTGLDELTGLPEYRNGGLLLDAGVLVPRDASVMAQPLSPSDEWVVEWRALTVALLDELLPRVRNELAVSAEALPLACMLEGGSWAAGRQIAAEKREGGAPPVTIDSDGTVF